MRTAKIAFLVSSPFLGAIVGCSSAGATDSSSTDADELHRRWKRDSGTLVGSQDAGSDASASDASATDAATQGSSDSAAPTDAGPVTDCSLNRCYYVRAGASGDGTAWSSALPDLPGTLERGAVYFVAGGTYAGHTLATAESGTTPISIKKATLTDHGTSTGWTDSYGDGQAVFSSAILIDSSYWVFDGQTGGGPGNWTGPLGFKVTSTDDGAANIRIGYSEAANHVTVRHVELQGKGSPSTQGGSFSNDAVAIYGSSDTTVSYAWIHGAGRCPFFIDTANSVFEYIYVQSFFGSLSVHSEIASIWSFGALPIGDMTFRYNLFTHLASTGGLMWDNSSNPSSHLDVYGNVFYEPAGDTWDVANGVIGGWTGGNGEEMHNVRVQNNSFVNINQEILSSLPRISSGNVAYNNIFYNSRSPDFTDFTTHDFNHFINSGDTQSEAHGTSATSGDPFVDLVGLTFTLKAATPAGMMMISPYDVDPLGLKRGADGIWDRGAYEFAP